MFLTLVAVPEIFFIKHFGLGKLVEAVVDSDFLLILEIALVVTLQRFSILYS